MFASLAAGVIVGAVEAVLAIAFAAFVFGGLLVSRLADGIGLYLVAAALTLGMAVRAGRRGVVGSVQDAAAAVLAVVATNTAAKAADIAKVAQATGLKTYEKPDVFLTVIAATLVVTILCGVVWALGTFRLGNLVRFVPYPVVVHQPQHLAANLAAEARREVALDAGHVLVARFLPRLVVRLHDVAGVAELGARRVPARRADTAPAAAGQQRAAAGSRRGPASQRRLWPAVPATRIGCRQHRRPHVRD